MSRGMPESSGCGDLVRLRFARSRSRVIRAQSLVGSPHPFGQTVTWVQDRNMGAWVPRRLHGFPCGRQPATEVDSGRQPATAGEGERQREGQDMAGSIERVRRMSVASVYPLYIAKAEKKGRTQAEVDEIIRWLTGYTPDGLARALKSETCFEAFFGEAPRLNPARLLITGVVCGVRVEEVEDQIMREVRYLDKLIDELARGRAMEKILRG